MRLAQFIVVFVFLALLFGTEVTQALTISPVKVEVTGDPGQTLNGEVELLNEQGEVRLFFSSFENFEPSGETGSPHFIGAEDGLATWLKTETNVSLGPGEKKIVPYSITIPEDAEPGGYFSAIFWGSQDPSTQSGGEVSIGGKLGVLILLRVAGDIPESAGISQYGTDSGARLFSSLPIAFAYRFNNNGGDRVVPRGDITIKNTLGLTTAQIVANVNEGNVLPNSSRKFVATWGEATKDGKVFSIVKQQLSDFHFGLYRAELSLVFGANEQVAEETFVFFIVPWQLLSVVVIILLGIIFGLKKYNAWIIARSNVKN